VAWLLLAPQRVSVQRIRGLEVMMKMITAAAASLLLCFPGRRPVGLVFRAGRQPGMAPSARPAGRDLRARRVGPRLGERARGRRRSPLRAGLLRTSRSGRISTTSSAGASARRVPARAGRSDEPGIAGGNIYANFTAGPARRQQRHRPGRGGRRGHGAGPHWVGRSLPRDLLTGLEAPDAPFYLWQTDDETGTTV